MIFNDTDDILMIFFNIQRQSNRFKKNFHVVIIKMSSLQIDRAKIEILCRRYFEYLVLSPTFTLGLGSLLCYQDGGSMRNLQLSSQYTTAVRKPASRHYVEYDLIRKIVQIIMDRNISNKSSNFWIKLILKENFEEFFPAKIRNKYQLNIREVSGTIINDIFYQVVVDKTRKIFNLR